MLDLIDFLLIRCLAQEFHIVVQHVEGSIVTRIPSPPDASWKQQHSSSSTGIHETDFRNMAARWL